MNATVQTDSRPASNFKAIFIMGVLYFLLGFITWLNSTLIPFLKLTCQLDNDVQAFFVTSASYMGYFFLALPSSWLLKKTGYKKGLALGLLVIAFGSVIFIPASHARSFPLFLTGLFIQSTGMSLLQTAINPYISIIGPIESAAKRISIMGICNKVAGMTSPLILSAVLLKNATSLETTITKTTDLVLKNGLLTELASRIVPPYVILTGILIALAIFLRLSPLPEINTDKEEDKDTLIPQVAKTSVFQFPHLLLGVLCLFVYVGVEVLAGDAIGTYGKAQGLPLDVTKNFTSFTLLAMLLGYITGIFTIPKIISQQTGLKISAILGMIFSVGAFATTGYVAIGFIAALGLANALMWPAIFPLAISGLGKFTKTGSGLLIMGIAGGAIFPLVYSSLKDKLHLPNNLSFFLCALPCYFYIFYYSVSGYKAGKNATGVLLITEKRA
ncbi:MAG TPA: sugar MFS transporter [Puia sp.]